MITSTIKQNADKKFAKLFPSLKKVDPQNFGSFLRDVLKACKDHVSVEDFYKLFYNNEYATLDFANFPNIDKPVYSKKKLEGLQLCQLALKYLQNPQANSGPLKLSTCQISSISSINPHELLRTFLAMKIMLSSVKKVKASAKATDSLSRVFVHRAYYIICQKLIHAYPEISNDASFQQNLTLSSAQFGKLAKILYPSLKSKRLGSRRDSVYHYIGLTWNTDVVDKETVGLLNLDLPNLQEYFKNLRNNTKTTQPQDNTTTLNAQVSKQHNLDSKITKTHVLLEKPLYSHVDLSTKYPNCSCAPRVWKSTPNSIPPHSDWARSVMENSMNILKCLNIDLEPLLNDISAGTFSDDEQKSLSGTVARAMKILSDSVSPKESFLHLYLSVLLMIFPAILASDEEVPCASKIQLRLCVSKCATTLDDESTLLPCVDLNSLTTFTRSLKRMIHINEMSSINVNAPYVKKVHKELARDIEILGKCKAADQGGLSNLEEILVRATVISINAYHFELVDKRKSTSNQESVDTITNIAKAISKAVLTASDTAEKANLLGENEIVGHATPDVPYQIFKQSVWSFHEITLSYPVMKQTPIPIITCTLHNMQREMQNASFQSFGMRDAELSKETFKTWWVMCVMIREYLAVISEVVALNHILR